MAEARRPAPDAGPPARGAPPGPGLARGVRQSVLVVLLLVGLAIVLTWPVAARLGDGVADLGDPLLTTWILAWDVHALASAPLRFFDANMLYPRRQALAYTEHLVGLVPLAAPARLLGAPPLLAHNLVWLATFPLTGLTMFWLVRHLTGAAGPAAVAAVLYAFSHFRFGQLGHVQVLSHQWLPLLLLGLHRAARSGGRWRDVGLAAGAFALQALSSGYQAFFAAIAGGLFVAWLAGPSTRPPLGRLAARGAIAGAVVALVLLPFFLPYRASREEIARARNPREIEYYMAWPAAYLAAPVDNRWLGDATAPFRRREAVLFPGVVALALALAGATLAGRPRREAAPRAPAPGGRWPVALDVALSVVTLVTLANWLLVGGIAVRLGPLRVSQRSFGWAFAALALAFLARRIVRGGPAPVRGLGWLRRLAWPEARGYYVALVLVGVLASFGPWLDLGAHRVQPLYQQLRAILPGFDALRVPGRFGVLVTTGLAVLAGLGAAALVRRIPRPVARAAALAAVGVLAALEAWATPLPLVSVATEPGPVDRWLAARPGPDAVAVLPMYEPHAVHLESVRLFASTAHWHPLVNGYAGVLPPGYAEDAEILNTFPSPAAVARLRELRVRYVVVYLGQYREEVRPELDAALQALPAGVTRVASFEQARIYEIGPAGPRASGDAGGADEGPRPRQRVGVGEPGRLQRVEAVGDREHGVEPVTLLGEPLTRALLPIDQDHQVLHHEAGGLERRDRLELRRAVGDDVVDHHDALAGLERPLDPSSGAVRLLLAPRVDERHAARQARGHRQRQPRVRDARDPVHPTARDRGSEEAADLAQHVRMRDHDPQIDVEGRGHPGLQHELAEADAADLVEPAHERGRAGVAHAPSSARIAAAAAAGSAAPVIGRPTTR